LKKAAKQAAGKKPTMSIMTWPQRQKGFIGPKPRVKGFGDRKERPVSAPTSRRREYTGGAPQFNGGRKIRVRHREWLQQITTKQSFSGAGRYIIQPGLIDNFPWLSQIAGSFENYKFKMLKYVYRNSTGTGTSGSILMSAQYDVNDPEFSSREDLMNYDGCREIVVWRDAEYNMNLEKGRLIRQYMVRTDALPDGLDPTTYDSAMYTICAVTGTDVPEGTVVGDLLVEYEIELFNPKMNPSLLGAFGVRFESSGQSSAAAFATHPMSGSHTVSTSPVPEEFKPRMSDTGLANPAINFPVPGTYSVRFSTTDPGGTAVLNQSGSTPFNDSTSVGVEWATVYKTVSTAASYATSFAANVVTLVENAKLVFNTFTSSGTASQPIFSALEVVPESTSYILDYMGTGPTPPMSRENFALLKKRYRNYNLKAIQQKIERHEANLAMDAYISERKKRLQVEAKRIVPSLEVPADSPAVENDSDFEDTNSLDRVVASDKRSKSSDRKEKRPLR
jgi:hypothetical protein